MPIMGGTDTDVDKNAARKAEKLAMDDGELRMAKKFRTGWEVILNFLIMSFCFSANHGTVSALIAVASSVQSKHESGANTSTLYFCYTFSSMLLANLFITKLGSKWTICLGLSLYVLYSASFLAAYYMGTSARWAVGLIATSISGIGAGGLWTAQTAFFSSSAKHYAALTGCEIVRANGIFAAIFVSFYLGFEILLKILTSLVQLKEHAVAVFTIFTIIAASSALGCVLFVRPVASVSNAPLTKDLIVSKVSAALRVYSKDKKIILMAPYNMLFGFASAFINQYANAEILPENHVGWYAATLVASGFTFSSLFGIMTKYWHIPKAVPMLLGAVAFCTFSVVFWNLTNEQIGAHKWLLVLMYIGFGIGRGAWEGTMKAVFADFFGGEDYSTAAFANIPMQNGIAGAVGFLVFSQVHDARTLGQYLIFVVSILGIAGYLMATYLHVAEGHHRQPSAVVKDAFIASTAFDGPHVSTDESVALLDGANNDTEENA